MPVVQVEADPSQYSVRVVRKEAMKDFLNN